MADWHLNIRIPNCNTTTRTFSKTFMQGPGLDCQGPGQGLKLCSQRLL